MVCVFPVVILTFCLAYLACASTPPPMIVTPSHYDLKWLKNGQNPKNKYFKFFLKVTFFTFLGLNTHTGGVKKLCFMGPGWLDWTKVAFFCLKMHLFAIFRWFWVQKLQITNLFTFVLCLIAQFSIVTHIQNRIKNRFLLIPAH